MIILKQLFWDVLVLKILGNTSLKSKKQRFFKLQSKPLQCELSNGRSSWDVRSYEQLLKYPFH